MEEENVDIYVKFAIIKHDMVSCDSTIIEVFNHKNDALEFCSDIIKNDEELDVWNKIEYENDTFSIFQLRYVLKKLLVSKYCIRPYLTSIE